MTTSAMTIDGMIIHLTKLANQGHGSKPLYCWKPGTWMEPSAPCVPTGQDTYAMIECNDTERPAR